MARCIKCGKTGDFRLFCGECYVKEHPLVRKVVPVDVRFCVNCKKFFSKNKWKEARDVSDAVFRLIPERIVFDDDYDIKEVGVAPVLHDASPKQGQRIDAETKIVIRAYSRENRCEVKGEIVVSLKLEFVLCEKCSLKGTQYFEGILQVRNADESVIESIMETIKEEELEGIHVNKVIPMKRGVDLYVTSNHYLKKLGIDLQRRFGGELSVHPRLQTKDSLTSKELYRLSVLLKLPDIRQGDYVEYANRIIHIKKSVKEVIGRDIIDNTNVRVDTKHGRPAVLEVHRTNITKIRPHIEALNPVSFQSERVENARKQKLGQRVRVVVSSKGLFVVA